MKKKTPSNLFYVLLISKMAKPDNHIKIKVFLKSEIHKF